MVTGRGPQKKPQNALNFLGFMTTMSAMIFYARWIVLCCVFCFASCLQAQSGGWDRVKQLPPGQQIRIARIHRGITCNFSNADEDTLICDKRQTILFFPVHHRVVTPRNEIRSIRLSRKGLSTLAGAAIGIGAGAGIGAGIDSSAKDQVEEGHIMTVALAFLGGFLGASIGQNSDFLAGPTVYRAP